MANVIIVSPDHDCISRRALHSAQSDAHLGGKPGGPRGLEVSGHTKRTGDTILRGIRASTGYWLLPSLATVACSWEIPWARVHTIALSKGTCPGCGMGPQGPHLHICFLISLAACLK